MAIVVNTLPQDIVPIKILTIDQLVKALPKHLDTSVNVWVIGKIAMYGSTPDNIVFLVDSDVEPDSSTKMFFNSIVEPFGFQATASNDWKCNNNKTRIRLYDKGELIIDKNTMSYTRPAPVVDKPFTITAKEVIAMLPKSVEWPFDIYMTGGVVKNGFSNNDVDFIVLDPIDRQTLVDIKNYLNLYISCTVHVGSSIMPDREPVYLYKVYTNGFLIKT